MPRADVGGCCGKQSNANAAGGYIQHQSRAEEELALLAMLQDNSVTAWPMRGISSWPSDAVKMNRCPRATPRFCWGFVATVPSYTDECLAELWMALLARSEDDAGGLVFVVMETVESIVVTISHLVQIVNYDEAK